MPLILWFGFLNIPQTSWKYHSCYFFFLLSACLCYCLHFVLHIWNVSLCVFLSVMILSDVGSIWLTNSFLSTILFGSVSVFQSPGWIFPPYFELLPVLSRSYIGFFNLCICLFESSVWSLISLFTCFRFMNRNVLPMCVYVCTMCIPDAMEVRRECWISYICRYR